MADWDPLVNEIFARAIEAGSPADRAARPHVARRKPKKAEEWRRKLGSGGPPDGPPQR